MPVRKVRIGRPSLFRRKQKPPLSILLNRTHAAMLKRGMRRTGLTRSDFVALLIDRHGDSVTIPRAQKRR